MRLGQWNLLPLLLVCFLVSFDLSASEYKLRMSKNDDLCNLLDKTKNSNEPYSSHAERKNIFTEVTWRKIPRNKSFLAAKYAYLDIDNNGNQNIVVQLNSTRNNTKVNFLSIHNMGDINPDSGFQKDDYINSEGKIALSSLSYPLDDLDEKPSAGSIEYGIHNVFVMSFTNVELFVFNSNVYLSIHDYINTERRKWLLIAKYNGGTISGVYKKSDKNVLDDVCYFEIID